MFMVSVLGGVVLKPQTNTTNRETNRDKQRQTETNRDKQRQDRGKTEARQRQDRGNIQHTTYNIQHTTYILISILSFSGGDCDSIKMIQIKTNVPNS